MQTEIAAVAGRHAGRYVKAADNPALLDHFQPAIGRHTDPSSVRRRPAK